MSKRLEILKASLVKKEQLLNVKFEHHFATVKQANGQPLNDKRNGQATLNKWERQNESIRTLKDSIEKTKQAIEWEKDTIKGVEKSKDLLPKEIQDLIENGELIQWRKYPNICFVKDVEKARIIWDKKKKVVAHKFYSSIPDDEQKQIFRFTYNKIALVLNKIGGNNG